MANELISEINGIRKYRNTTTGRVFEGLEPSYIAGVSTVIAALGSTSNLSALVVANTIIAASNFTASNAAAPTKAEVDAGIDTLKTAVVTALNLKADNVDCETLRTQIEVRLDAIEAKIDAFLAANKTSGQMAAA